jgi:hypothetical protein
MMDLAYRRTQFISDSFEVPSATLSEEVRIPFHDERPVQRCGGNRRAWLYSAGPGELNNDRGIHRGQWFLTVSS